MCKFVCEIERERERGKERKRDGGRERERECATLGYNTFSVNFILLFRSKIPETTLLLTQKSLSGQKKSSKMKNDFIN